MAKTDIGEYDITCKHCHAQFTPDELTGQRLFLDIAAALRQRDVNEAVIALERLATEMGWDACEEVNRGLHTSLPLFETAA